MAQRSNAPARSGAGDPGWTPSPQAARRELKRARRQRARQRRLKRLALALLAAVVLGWVTASQLLEVVMVSQSAMTPTLPAGSVVVCLRRSSPLIDWLRDRGITLDALTGSAVPGAGQIALIDLDGRSVLRRVMATQGQRVDFSDTDLLVNGVRASHETVRGDADYPMTVPNGEYFVMGDARALSRDSRYKRFGCVRDGDIRGRAVAVIWPVWAAGTLRTTMNP